MELKNKNWNIREKSEGKKMIKMSSVWCLSPDIQVILRIVRIILLIRARNYLIEFLKYTIFYVYKTQHCKLHKKLKIKGWEKKQYLCKHWRNLSTVIILI